MTQTLFKEPVDYRSYRKAVLTEIYDTLAGMSSREKEEMRDEVERHAPGRHHRWLSIYFAFHARQFETDEATRALRAAQDENRRKEREQRLAERIEAGKRRKSHYVQEAGHTEKAGAKAKRNKNSLPRRIRPAIENHLIAL